MEQYTIADLIEMFAWPIGVIVFLVVAFIGSRGGSCMSHGRYRTKICHGCKAEQRQNAEQYDRNYARLKREGRLPL